MAILIESQGVPVSKSAQPSSPKSDPLFNIPPIRDGASFKATRNQLNPVELAILQLEASYDNLKESIRLEAFDKNKIEDYIRRAEKHIRLTTAEKNQIRVLSKSNDPEILKLIALQLRVGIPRKAERRAFAELGRLLVLYRGQEDQLKEFLTVSGKDPNLRAHIRMILLMSVLERWLLRYERWAKRLHKFAKFFGYGNDWEAILGLEEDSSDPDEEKE